MVSFVIRTAVSVPADTVSEEGNAISAQLVTMVSPIVSVSVLNLIVSVCKPDHIFTVCLFSNLYSAFQWSVVKRFKTKLNTLAKHNGQKQYSEPIKTRRSYM